MVYVKQCAEFLQRHLAQSNSKRGKNGYFMGYFGAFGVKIGVPEVKMVREHPTLPLPDVAEITEAENRPFATRYKSMKNTHEII